MFGYRAPAGAWSHFLTCQEYDSILARLGAKFPRWAREYLAGYRDACNARLYATELTFYRLAPDGTFWIDWPREYLASPPPWAIGSRNMRELYGSADGSWKRWPTGHAWRTGGTHKRPELIPYFQALDSGLKESDHA